MQAQDLFARTQERLAESGLNIGSAASSRSSQVKARLQSRIYTGAMAIESKAALYLIFPAQGVLASHLIALDYLNACGYAPVVISNLPIAPEDLPLLQARAAIVAERPNFGYDFGGYEHGIYLLRAHMAGLERLAIFNDSSWFPMDPTVNWFDMAEALDKDLVGAYAHEAVDFRGVHDLRDLAWDWNTKNKFFHYCSFALLLKGPVLRSKAFRRFWTYYLATDDKHRTVLRGEIGLTRRLVDAGFSHGATWPTIDLPAQIAAHDPEIVRQLVSERIHTESDYYDRLFDGLKGADPEMTSRIFLGLVARQGPAYSLAAHDLAFRQGQFVKKAPLKWSASAARATLAMLRRTKGAEVFLAEAEEALARGESAASSQDQAG
ncbi:rhamnan synthesis F family protein [Rhodobacter sp. KR11]|uniref:rhamnan synthesis F family protein n=1 Tax=Rhodobacter sp. KR11 TaxID=2974588 RepID=UPI002223990B|nr:rhamnan synthesis F family protein [Rhodobacter sp. KR11]MCW1918751.1 rhamnan synthesis F family protein [Rhodobacter sp. KR11]